MTALIESGLHVPEDTLEQELGVRSLLEARWAEGKFLCVGLDVVPGTGEEGPTALFEKAKLIVDATHDIAAAYKPNSAFYENETSDGFKQLEMLVGYIKQLAPDVPVIWDAKRADIAKTNEGYDHAAHELGVDGLTLHPYLGGTAVKPLLSDSEKIGFVLAHTSNPGAAEFQHLRLQSGEMLWERVVSNVAHSEDWQHGSVLGIVTGATYPQELARARYLAGDEVVMLIPGVGTQGGDLEASVRGAMNSRGNGFIINVSSGISGAKDANDKVTKESVRDAAIKYHEQIREVWQDAKDNPQPSYGELEITEYDQRLAVALFEQECIKFGKFTLRNKTISPVYVDLRASITDPTLRGNIAQIYVDMINGLEDRRGEKFDVLAGVPQAVTSYAAIVAERMERRLVQPRAGVKDHGTSKLVEGNFEKGESVGVIDDLIQDGGAKFEAIAQMEAAGLIFGGLALLVDREKGGFREMAARGNPIIASTTLRHLVIALGEKKLINPRIRNKVLQYLQ
jgi:orotidine 5'-phosphate decarboxylase subfamily 2